MDFLINSIAVMIMIMITDPLKMNHKVSFKYHMILKGWQSVEDKASISQKKLSSSILSRGGN